MRRIIGGLGLTVLLAAGCATGPFSRPFGRSGQAPAQVPRADQVVAHLNQECRQIKSVEFSSVSIQVKQGLQSFGVNGMLAYQKPRNFRLMAEALGSTQADVGSNDQEFWFWFKEGNAPLYRCSYEDLPKLRSLTIPVQPDWIAEGLCLQEFGPADQYQVRTSGQNLLLISQSQGTQGQTLQKVTTISLAQGPLMGRVIGTQVRNAQGEEVWSAEVTRYQNVGGYNIPHKVTLRCPTQKMELQFRLDGGRINSVVAGGATFSRPRGYQEIDLARGTAPVATPQSIQRVRGNSPQ